MSALRKLRAARQQQQAEDHDTVQANDSATHTDIGATPSINSTDTPSSSTATSSTLSAATSCGGKAQSQTQAGHKAKRKRKQPQLRPVYSTAAQQHQYTTHDAADANVTHDELNSILSELNIEH